MIIKDASLPADHESDPWVAAFICELHELFGTPVTGSICKNKEDKIQYLWSLFGIANALAAHESSWRPMRNKVEPNIAAEAFARRYYNATKKMIIEPAPIFSDRGEKSKALTGPTQKVLK